MCKFQENLKLLERQKDRQKNQQKDGQKNGRENRQKDRQALTYRNLLTMAGNSIKHLPTFAKDYNYISESFFIIPATLSTEMLK